MDRNPPIVCPEMILSTKTRFQQMPRCLIEKIWYTDIKQDSYFTLQAKLTLLNSIYLFPKTSATLIDCRENATVGGYLNFRFHMFLNRAVMNIKQDQSVKQLSTVLSQ